MVRQEQKGSTSQDKVKVGVKGQTLFTDLEREEKQRSSDEACHLAEISKPATLE